MTGTTEVPSTEKPSINPRILTGALVVVTVLVATYFGAVGIASLFALIAIFGGFELRNIVDRSPARSSLWIHVILASIPLLYFGSGLADPMIYKASLILCVVLMSLLIANLWRSKSINYSRIKYPFTFFYWGLPYGLATYFLFHSERSVQVMFFGVILLLWTSDTMAYVTGKAIGKNKLFPSVSPGKTKEGSLGGGFFAIMVGVAYAYFMKEPMTQWAIIAVIVWILGTLGDLVESKLKRTQNVKDSGSILPGHGGFLDRFDSLVMVLPYLLLLNMVLR